MTTAGVIGCGDPPAFRADDLAVVAQQLAPVDGGRIQVVLGELFGDPDAPRTPPGLSEMLDLATLERAAGPVTSTRVGETTTGLYRRHCARCHGLTGDGRGPAALYQAPYPRDFRRGVFKHKSTMRAKPPTDADLHAVLERGVAGSAMPSFRLLSDEERSTLVDYVKYLAIRGQTESALIEYCADELDSAPNATDEILREELADVAAELVEEIAARWNAASRTAAPVEPPPSVDELDRPERIAAGRELFHDVKRANCVKCHGSDGRGVAIDDYDDWNKRRREFAERTASLAAQADKSSAPDPEIARREAVAREWLPPVPVLPKPLQAVRLACGDQPTAIFHVIHEGVAGTPMPGVGATLTDDEVLNLVAYVRSLAHRGAEPGGPMNSVAMEARSPR